MDRLEFRGRLILPNGKRWGEVWEPWQVQRVFRPLDATNPDGTPRYMLVYVQLHVGAAKSTHAAAQGLVDLIFGARHQQLHLIAVDKDQADIIFNIAKGFIARAEEIGEPLGLVEQKNTIRNPENGSVWYRHSSDVPSSSGHDVYRLYADEIQNAPNGDLFSSFYLRLGKQRPHSQALVLGNAGWSKDQIAWKIYQEAANHPEYAYCWAPEDFRAGFIHDLDRLAATLTPVEYDRLIRNVWRFGNQSLFTREAVEACLTNELDPPVADAGRPHWFGVDLGFTGDPAAAALVRRTRTADTYSGLPVDIIDLLELQTWQGSKQSPVQVDWIDDWILDRAQRYKIDRGKIDAYQARSTEQRFGSILDLFTYSQSSKATLSKLLWQLISERRLRIPAGAPWASPLVDELVGLVQVQTRWGWHFDHEPNKHDDQSQALAMAALAAMEADVPDAVGRVSRASVGHSTHGWSRVPGSTVSGRVAEVDRRGNLRYVRAAGGSGAARPATDVPATRAAYEKANPSGESEFAPWRADGSDPTDWLCFEDWNWQTGRYDKRYARRPGR